MKFNPTVVRAIMHTQFYDLKRARATDAETPEDHFKFPPEEVEEIHFNKGEHEKGVWFRLKDGRVFDVRGQLTEGGSVADADGGQKLPGRPGGGARAVTPDQVSDRDAIDVLPLSMIPLSGVSLKTARLIKNSRLETVVELHHGPSSGSLLLRPEDIPATFPGTSKGDRKIIDSLSSLQSYDVYSLRTSLRKLGIGVDGAELELSDAMKNRLNRYTGEFTKPLLRAVFGAGSDDGEDHESLLRIFRDPDRTRAAGRLKVLAEKTRMPLETLPQFLETYSDVFLSVAYCRYSFEHVMPSLSRFSVWMADLRGGSMKISTQAGLSCRKVEESLRFLSASIRRGLGYAREAFDVFWNNMSEETFARLRREVEERHIATVAMVCGLVVKMRHWSQTFRDSGAGGPTMRARYLVSEMEPGLEGLCRQRA